MGRSIESSGTVPPLDADDGSSTSDHRIGFLTSRIARKEAFEWITYSYRLCTDKARKDFGTWVVMQDWIDVLEGSGPDAKGISGLDRCGYGYFLPIKNHSEEVHSATMAQ